MTTPTPETIIALIVEHFGDTEAAFGKTITEETELDDIGLDSLDLLELAFDAEERFDIEITNDAMDGIRTVADVVRVAREAAGMGAAAEG